MTVSIWTLDSACTCTEYDSETETDTGEPASECYGCYEEALDNLKYELKAWREANNLSETDLVDITGEGMGWRRVSGYAQVKAERIPDALTLNGEFRIEFSISEDYKTLTAIRYSHDEPTGTGVFTFTKAEPGLAPWEAELLAIQARQDN